MIKLAQRIADAADSGADAEAMLQAGRAVMTPNDRNVVRLADLVTSARNGLESLLENAPNDKERARVETLIGVYRELDTCCSELANAIVSNNQARRKLFLPKVAEATEKAKAGVEAAKSGDAPKPAAKK